MSNIEKIKSELRERWSENATVELCLIIIDFLGSVDADDLRMLTFTSFKNATKKSHVDEDLIRAIALLANTSIDALDSRLLFIDDNAREFEVANEDLAAARRQGTFVHPETGEAVPEFESKIIPFFVPSEKLLKLRAD